MEYVPNMVRRTVQGVLQQKCIEAILQAISAVFSSLPSNHSLFPLLLLDDTLDEILKAECSIPVGLKACSDLIDFMMKRLPMARKRELALLLHGLEALQSDSESLTQFAETQLKTSIEAAHQVEGKSVLSRRTLRSFSSIF